MEKSLWRIPVKYDHSLDPRNPKNIVLEQCDGLRRQTKGKIIAKISQYSGEVRNRPNRFSSLSKQMVDLANDIIIDSPFNVQSELGESGTEAFTYEFFITSKKTPQYKYRPFFLLVAMTGYPATIILEQDIADELELAESTECNTAEEFEALLGKILSSDRIFSILDGLLSHFEID